MAQPAARAETPPAAGLTVVHDLDLESLGRDWTVIKGCRLRPADRGSAPTVLIHPERGIAVVDVPPSETPDAVEAVRERLGAARFDGIFAGHLPVVAVRSRAGPRQTPALSKLLDDAFAASPPLSLPGGDAWAGVAMRALTAEHHAPRRAEAQRVAEDGSAEAGVRPWPAQRRLRRRRRWFRTLRRAAVLLLGLAALGGVLAAVVNEAPFRLGASDPGAIETPASAPAPVAAAAPAGRSERPVEEPTPPAVVAASPTAPAQVGPPAAAAPRARPGAGGDGSAAAFPEAAPIAPSSALETSTAAGGGGAAVPPPARRQAATPSAQGGKPPERAGAPPRQQRRQDAAGADAPPAPAGGAVAAAPEPASQRCGRIAALVGSGGPLADADMRFFNQACIRW